MLSINAPAAAVQKIDKFIAGTANPPAVYPEKENEVMATSFTEAGTSHKINTLTTHRNIPKVSRLIGSSNKFATGFTVALKSVSAIPAQA